MTLIFVVMFDLNLLSLYIPEGAMAWSEEHQRLLVMQDKTIDVWDIFEEQRVSLILQFTDSSNKMYQFIVPW